MWLLGMGISYHGAKFTMALKRRPGSVCFTGALPPTVQVWMWTHRPGMPECGEIRHSRLDKRARRVRKFINHSRCSNLLPECTHDDTMKEGATHCRRFMMCLEVMWSMNPLYESQAPRMRKWWFRVTNLRRLQCGGASGPREDSI